MDDQLQGFLDESNKPMRDRKTGKVTDKGNFYAVGAAVVFDGCQEETRRELLRIRNDLGFELHYNDLSKSRRLKVIDEVVAIDTWDGYLFETANPIPMRSKGEHRARAHTMGRAFVTLGNQLSIKDLVLESRSKPAAGFTTLDKHDNETLQKLQLKQEVPRDLRIRHESKDEPLLWIADLLAGARTDLLCHTQHRDNFALLAHRVQGTYPVLGS